MAVAYCLLTRLDLCVFVTYLQRHAQAPTNKHLRHLNTIVRWAKKHPLRLIYRVMKCVRTIAHTDSGFCKEIDNDGVPTGRATKGSNFLRLGTSPADGGRVEASVRNSRPKLHSATPCHILEWAAGAVKQVARSTFTSETLAAVYAADTMIVFVSMLHAIAIGPQTTREMA